jgi:hypothetical protein
MRKPAALPQLLCHNCCSPVLNAQVGSKLRVVGAELKSDRPAEPLEAARWALLLLSYNCVSPAAWDTKLGLVKAGHTLRSTSGFTFAFHVFCCLITLSACQHALAVIVGSLGHQAGSGHLLPSRSWLLSSLPVYRALSQVHLLKGLPIVKQFKHFVTLARLLPATLAST